MSGDDKLDPVVVRLAQVLGLGAPVVVEASYFTGHVEGAFENGSRVRKTTKESGDYHEIGALAIVVGSVGPLEGEFGYFVYWDDVPGVPVFVRGHKIELVP